MIPQILDNINKLDTKIFITTNLVKVVLYATIIYYPYKIGKDNKVLEQYKIFQKNHDSKFIIRFNYF